MTPPRPAEREGGGGGTSILHQTQKEMVDAPLMGRCIRMMCAYRWRIAGRPVDGHGVEVVNPRLYRGGVIVSLPRLVQERRRW